MVLRANGWPDADKVCSKEEALAAVIAAVEGPASPQAVGVIAAGTARLLGPKGRELQADDAEAIRAEGDVSLCVVLISAQCERDDNRRVARADARAGRSRGPRYRPSACSPSRPSPAFRASSCGPISTSARGRRRSADDDATAPRESSYPGAIRNGVPAARQRRISH